MRKTVSHLSNAGPSSSDDLPYSIGPADKMSGVRVFKLTSATKTKVGGMVSPVYYLEDEHEKPQVIRAFLHENPQLVEALPQQSLHRMIGGHGREWRDVAPTVTEEFYEEDAVAGSPA